MILIDTSVMVNYLRNIETPMTKVVEEICEMDLRIGFSAYTYMELLCGAKNDREFSSIQESLSQYPIYYLKEKETSYSTVARMYFELRRNGVTPRNITDLMIAATAIYHDLYLLHDDRDFDLLAPFFPELKIYPSSYSSN